jgi:hypothetical protein
MRPASALLQPQPTRTCAGNEYFATTACIDDRVMSRVQRAMVRALRAELAARDPLARLFDSHQ